MRSLRTVNAADLYSAQCSAFSNGGSMKPLFGCRNLQSLVLAIVLAAFSGPAAAQTSNATLQGTIVDTSGAVLPGVVVKLESPATGLSREIVTNAAGVYVFNF